jgi:hypothetical protein
VYVGDVLEQQSTDTQNGKMPKLHLRYGQLMFPHNLIHPTIKCDSMFDSPKGRDAALQPHSQHTALCSQGTLRHEGSSIKRGSVREL